MASGVVVLGGGLAGVACAQKLGDEGLRVTLIDRNDYLQFQPLLYQVATSQLPAEDIARPHRAIFRSYPTVDVVTTDVLSASLADRSVTTVDGQTLSGSHLVMAAGARPNFFGVPGAEDHAFPLYSVADAERLRRHLQSLLTDASSSMETDPDTLNVVVVGGGPTGVETTGAVSELIDALRAKDLLKQPCTVTLVDRGKVLLAQFSSKAHAYSLRKLTDTGAEVRLGLGVSAVHKDSVEFDDGSSISTQTVVWAGGESGAQVTESTSTALGRGGRLDVLSDLSVDGFPGVFAVGDVANIPSGQSQMPTLPQLGSVAQQSGKWAAENILRERQGEATLPFRYKDKGIMAMIARNAAVAEVGKHRHQVEGPIAFAAWLGVHAMLLSGVHSKTDAFLSWGWDYFERDHSAIVEASSTPKRLAWGDDDEDVPHISVGPSASSSTDSASSTST